MLHAFVRDVESSAIELEALLSEALGRFGVAGTIRVSVTGAVLSGNGPPVTVDVGDALVQWPGLTEAQKQKRANDLARRLSNDRRVMASATGEKKPFSLPSFLAPAAIAVLAALAIGGTYRFYQSWLASHDASRRPVVADYDAYEKERLARASRVCAATRTRVMRGAVIGPADAEGWVVELTVLREPGKPSLVNDPALASFFTLDADAAKHTALVHASVAPVLTSLEGPDTKATFAESNVPPLGAPDVRGLQIVFGGRYAVPFFTDNQRAEYVNLARSITDALGAEYAALYARCADGTAHHVGSWFRGPNPGGALAALLYFMGTFGEPADVRQALLLPPGAGSVDRAFAFKNVSAATEGVNKTRAVTLVSPELGALSGTDGQLSTLTFPFRDSNRASRASRGVARALGIGDGR
jgi:hypothetical protein